MKRTLCIQLIVLMLFSFAVDLLSAPALTPEARLLQNYTGEKGVRLAVLPPVSEMAGKKLSADLQERYSRMLEQATLDPRFKLVERDLLSGILKEKELQQSGLVNAETATSIGQLAAADCVITIRKTSAGVEYRILKVSSAEILSFYFDRTKSEVDDENSLLSASLIAAVVDGNAKTAADILSDGASPNARRADGLTAMYMAIYKDRPDIVKLLLDSGAKTEFTMPRAGEMRIPYIFLAASQGNVDTAKHILKKNISVSIERKLLEPRPDIKPGEQASAIEGAAISGKIDMLKLLMEYGAESNDQALAAALSSYERYYTRGDLSNPKRMETFIFRRAPRKEYEDFILQLIQQRKFFFCEDSNATNDIFIEVAATLHTDFVKKMLPAGGVSCVNAKTASKYIEGNTAFHAVISTFRLINTGSKEAAEAKLTSKAMIDLLLQNGADPSTANREGEDAVYFAVSSPSSVDLALYILDHSPLPYSCAADEVRKNTLNKAIELETIYPKEYAVVVKRLRAACR